MKITARVNNESLSLVNILNQRGVTAKLVKGGVIVELPARRWDSDKSDVYSIPPEVNGATLFLDVTEHGGGMTNTGAGTIVCGLSGKALRPYFVPRGHANDNHAFFAVPNAVVTVTGYRRDGNVTIEKHQIVRENDTATIKSEKLWDGQFDELPETFRHFQDAAQAASDKGNCYHCRCVHFAVRS